MDAAALHRDAFVFDLHSHALLNMTYLRRDLARRHPAPWVYNPLRNTIDLPRLREGGVDGLVWTVYVPWNPLVPRDRAAFAQADVFAAFVAAHPDQLAHVRTAGEARAAAAAGKLACFLAVEGGHCLGGRLEHVEAFARRGAVYLTITHFVFNGIASSSDFGRLTRDRGVTPFGREVLRELERCRILPDLAHCSERAFWQALDLCRGPVVFSHTGARALQAIQRNLSDRQARALAEKGGLMGVIFWPPYHRRGVVGRLEHLLDTICHLATVAGPAHVGLGSDLDGWTWTPLDFPDVTHLPRLTEGLLARGFSGDEVRGILGENFLRVLAQVRP